MPTERRFAIAFAARWRPRELATSTTISSPNARRRAASRIEASSFVTSGGSPSARTRPRLRHAPPTVSGTSGSATRDPGGGSDVVGPSDESFDDAYAAGSFSSSSPSASASSGKGAAGTRGAAGAPPSPSRERSRAGAVVPVVPARVGATNTGPSAFSPNTTSVARTRSSIASSQNSAPTMHAPNTSAARGVKKSTSSRLEWSSPSSRCAMGAPSAPSRAGAIPRGAAASSRMEDRVPNEADARNAAPETSGAFRAPDDCRNTPVLESEAVGQIPLFGGAKKPFGKTETGGAGCFCFVLVTICRSRPRRFSASRSEKKPRCLFRP